MRSAGCDATRVTQFVERARYEGGREGESGVAASMAACSACQLEASIG